MCSSNLVLTPFLNSRHLYKEPRVFRGGTKLGAFFVGSVSCVRVQDFEIRSLLPVEYKIGT